MTRENTENLTVHLCDWASQPDIRIKCSQAMTTPEWGVAHDLPEGVYHAVNGDVYTFERSKATCAECNPNKGD